MSEKSHETRYIGLIVTTTLVVAGTYFYVDSYLKHRKEELRNISMLNELATAYHELGKEQCKCGEYPSALISLNYSLQIGNKSWKDNPIAFGNRAAIWMKLGYFQNAINDCDAATKLNPNLIKLYLRKGEALMQLRQYDEAKIALQKVIEQNNNQLHQSTLHPICNDGTIMACQSRAQQKIYELQYIQLNAMQINVNHFEESQDYHSMLKLSDEILQINHHFINGLISKSKALHQLYRHIQLKSFLEHFIISTIPIAHFDQRNQSHETVRLPTPYDLEWNDTQINKIFINIVSVIQLMLHLGPSLSQYYIISLQNISHRNEDYLDVMTFIKDILIQFRQRLIPSDYNRGGPWFWVIQDIESIEQLVTIVQRADQLLAVSKYQEALEQYLIALTVTPHAIRYHARLHCSCGKIYFHQRIFKKALEQCHQAIIADAEYPTSYLYRAKIYKALEYWEKSAKDYEKYFSFVDITLKDKVEIQIEYDEVMECKGKYDKIMEEKKKINLQKHLENFEMKKKTAIRTNLIERILQIEDDNYEILELNKYSILSRADIERSYKKLSKMVHPDKNNNTEASTIAFRKITDAKNQLLGMI